MTSLCDVMLHMTSHQIIVQTAVKLSEYGNANEYENGKHVL
jgi:hypothetical protein